MKPQDRIARLQPVRRVAEKRERDAATVLAAALATLRDAEETLAQLVQYRSGYVRTDAAGRVDAVRWQDYHTFLDKLDQAMTAQRAVIDDQKQRVDAARDQWQSARARVAALGKVTQRLRDVAERSAQRVLQRDLDERASHAATSQPFSR